MSKLFLFLAFISFTTIAQPLQYRNLPYIPADRPGFSKERHILDVYRPDSVTKDLKVAVFIHGGKWRVGSKENYRFLGKKLAKHNVVTVVINYRLCPPAANYAVMATDCAEAVKWVYENIETYGGDRNKIFLYGHSSGGHLCALIASNNRFFDSVEIANPVKGCVLLDAFGLNINRYLSTASPRDRWMFDIFTKDPLVWKDAAPVNFIRNDGIRYLLYNGGNSPYRIRQDADQFFDEAIEVKKDTRLRTSPFVGHLGLLFQLYYTKHKMYKEFLEFMEEKTSGN